MAKVTVNPALTETVVKEIVPETVNVTLNAEEAEYLTWLVAHVHLSQLTVLGEQINNRLYNAFAQRNQSDEQKQSGSYENYIWSEKRSKFGHMAGRDE